MIAKRPAHRCSVRPRGRPVPGRCAAGCLPRDPARSGQRRGGGSAGRLVSSRPWSSTAGADRRDAGRPAGAPGRCGAGCFRRDPARSGQRRGVRSGRLAGAELAVVLGGGCRSPRRWPYGRCRADAPPAVSLGTRRGPGSGAVSGPALAAAMPVAGPQTRLLCCLLTWTVLPTLPDRTRMYGLPMRRQQHWRRSNDYDMHQSDILAQSWRCCGRLTGTAGTMPTLRPTPSHGITVQDLPPRLAEIARQLGEVEPALKVAAFFNGKRMTVPAKIPPHHPIAKGLGPEIANVLVDLYGGTLIEWPRAAYAIRRQKARAMRAEGKSVPEIARALSIAERSAWRLVARQGQCSGAASGAIYPAPAPAGRHGY